jgi:hypothetical protein
MFEDPELKFCLCCVKNLFLVCALFPSLGCDGVMGVKGFTQVDGCLE